MSNKRRKPKSGSSKSKKSVKPIVNKNATQLAKSLNLKTSEVRPSGKYPALFYQEGGKYSYARLRIIYPNGSTDWRSEVDHTYEHLADGSYQTICCWSGIGLTFEQQIKRMHEFDLSMNFEPAVYLGEIK